MINTYTSSYVPSPVPPKLGGRASSKCGTRPLAWFLSVMLAIHMGGCLVGFIYLYHRSAEFQDKFQGRYHEDLIVLRRLQECEDGQSDSATLLDCKKILDTYKKIIAELSQAEGRADPRLGGVLFRNSAAVAHMIVNSEKSRSPSETTLRWNREHSLLVNVDYLQVPNTLRIRANGDYYVYSQVTFSQKAPGIPLVQRILLRRNSNGVKVQDVLLKSFCGIKDDGGACTSFQGGIFRLEKGQELQLDVSHMTLLSFDPTATTFGLFMV